MNIKSLFQKYNISATELYSTNGLSFDLGIASSPLDNFIIGIKIDNIVGEYNFTEKISDDSMPYKEKIPLRLIFGASYNSNDKLLLLFQNESIYISEDIITQRFSSGIEYNVNTSIPLIVRFGFRQIEWKKENNNSNSIGASIMPSAGIGIKYKLMNKFLLNLDYAFQFDKVGLNNFIRISTQLK